MSASSKCHHPGLQYSIVTELGAGDGMPDFAKVTAAYCPHCERRWRFVGVAPGFDADAPSVNRTATEILLPMVEIAG